ncbi:DNA replication/repair protein RecF [Elioraea tepidiphila]|jgi:DNA replication and repair protein RecF|uniref:DNA replication/repair protein RecF n=1 Tax=Elioraea tepidiphila TaxID=457934 RepID=UPI00036C698D|nr:DNA replication/repair protein RecF [Elioraea tepidiphila]
MAPALALTRLTLTRFRSYTALTARFAAPIAVLVGENGAGKTNLLEAISLLTPGRGLRGARLAEFARREPDGSTAAAWAVAGRFTTPEGPLDLGTGVEEAGATRRTFLLDGAAPRSQAEIAARVAAVWLTPQMDRLFQDGASARRRFLDRLVWAIEPGHAREVAAYETALAERNRLLAGRADPAWLDGLEDAMARHGIAVAAARRGLVARLNHVLAGGIAGAFPAARAEVACDWAAALDSGPALAAEEALRARLREGRGADAASGTTRIGPHRADLALIHGPKNLPAALCSTGEQKALLVSVVLGHAALIAEARGFAPILLLDEVAAHLDEPRREALFTALAALPAQAFLTGMEGRVFAPLAAVAEAFRVEGGMLDPMALGPALPGASGV